MKTSHAIIEHYINQLKNTIDKYSLERNNAVVQLKQQELYLDEIINHLDASKEALITLNTLLKTEE